MAKTKEFWKKAGIRAAWTMAETALATIGTAALLQEVNWPIVASASILSGIVSILKSIAVGLPELEEGNAKK